VQPIKPIQAIATNVTHQRRRSNFLMVSPNLKNPASA
jgi:hypothetical protein